MMFVTAILDDIKIQHTLFALPFAFMSAFLADGGNPGWKVIGLITLAMVFARSAAMAFNRLADRRYDRLNPRTNQRALPRGALSVNKYIAFTILCSIGFLTVCAFLNDLALKLAPLALLVVFFYSYTKRFTSYSHLFLGLALSLAPIGAWVAVRENLAEQPIIIALAVLFWLAGLDTIYSCQDVDFDLQHGLRSIPQKFGVEKALRLSAMFHVVMVLLLVFLAWVSALSWIYLVGVFFTAALLFYEHSIVKADDLTRVNIAFFNVNGVISIALALFAIVDILL